MDEQAFALLIEPHKRALHLHCYRMLGSLHDADDALQETMLRAWRGSDRYEPRAQLTTWLHTIATNVCLTAIARERARPAELVEDLEHLQPYPDRLLEDLVARETVELAFITAIQLLPPKQRAALILRDVLGWSAKEVAEALDDSFASVPRDGRLDEILLVPTSTNRQPAIAAYARDDANYQPYGLMVLETENGHIRGIYGFPDPWLFTRCGLPPELASSAADR